MRNSKLPGLQSVDAVVVINGKEDDVVYSKTSSLQSWLFGYELQDTAVVFCKKAVHILTSKKKCEFLKPVESNSNKENEDFTPVHVHMRETSDKDKANIDSIVKYIKESKEGHTVGHFVKDKFASEFFTSFKAAFKAANFEMVDVSVPFGELFAVKDELELGLMRKSAEVSCTIFNKYLREQIMDVIDKERKTKHIKLSTGCDDAIKNKKYNLGLVDDFLEVCYPPIIQSGGKFSLKFTVESDKNPLNFGVIVCSLGIRYKLYCSNVIRTLMVNPSAEHTKNYDFLSEVYDFALKKIEPGLAFTDFYNAIVKKVEDDRPDLKDNLIKTFGFVTGVEFRDSTLLIGPKSTGNFRPGMTINLNIGFQDLTNRQATEKEDKNYSLWVGDVLAVKSTKLDTEDNLCDVFTVIAKRRTKTISFVIKENESGDSEDDDVKDANKPEEILGRGARSAVLEQKTRNENNTEDKRLSHQRELYETLMTESKARLGGLKSDGGAGKKTKSNIAYKGAGQMPKEEDIRKLRLYVDKKYETVILPIFGTATPFHISTIKNISSSIEGDYTYLRVNFFHPGAHVGVKDAAAFQEKRATLDQFPEATYVKELTFRASNEKKASDSSGAASMIPATNLNTAFRIIKEVQKRYKTREAEEREKEDLVEQDDLIVAQSRGGPKLKDLFIRPNIMTKRVTGSLEAHVNGFRFTSIRGDKVDIMFNNIKHAFYQTCDSEMIILLHFHLKNAILFGKKKHFDVQFYTEVGEITTDLGKAHHMHDRDDLEAEQRERDLRSRLKIAFKSFCERTEVFSKGALEFDQPYRNLGFSGSPFRSTVLLQPTSGCLVHLTEWPPFVIILDEVEFVYFERVCLQIRNFDMVFVFKDYSRKVSMINSIPATSLDHVKEWLDSCDIYYMEGVKSLNWPKLMKTILDDPEGFFEDGGWTFIAPDDSEEEAEEDDDDEDVAYNPTESDSEEGSEEASEEEDSEEEDWSAEESPSEEELGSDESEGKDWDDLEAEAKRADADMNSEDEVDRNKKNRKRPHDSPSKKHKSGGGHHSHEKKAKRSRHESPSPKKKKHHHKDKKRRS